MTTTKKVSAKEADRLEAVQELRRHIKAGDTVYTILRHVSKSGMSRSIDLAIMRDGVPWVVTYLAARAMGDRIDQNHGGIKTGGCGMDTGFHLVYGLSHRLFADGFYCTGGKECPANDHNNERWDNVKQASMESVYSVERKHSDAGYALRQRWL